MRRIHKIENIYHSYYLKKIAKIKKQSADLMKSILTNGLMKKKIFKTIYLIHTLVTYLIIYIDGQEKLY